MQHQSSVTRTMYDESGNPAEISGEGLHRSLVWDCENRLRLIDDGDKLHLYTYDHTGERALKRYGNKTNVGIDAGESQSVIENADGYSAYFSPYFVETDGRYTKHYYAGTQRMASRVESMPKGMGEEPEQPEQAEQPDSQKQASETASKQPSKEEKEAMRDFNNMQNIKASDTGTTTSGASNASAVAGANESAPDLYYYHTDHLGSTTFIIDRNGDVAQYLAYTPYGETFIEERNVTPYKFNGKELDAETGYYYYGARYYDPSAALWLGVDPLAEKYPGVSPYVYCAGNPVKYVDQDGKLPTAVVGALIGATVNATIAICEGKSGSEVLAAAAGGAVSGAIIGSGGFLLGAASGVAGDVVEQGLNIMMGNSDEYSVEQTVVCGISSGVAGGLSKAAKTSIEKTGKEAVKQIEARSSSKAYMNKITGEVKSDFKAAGKPTSGHATHQKINNEAKSRISSKKAFDIKLTGIKTGLKGTGADVTISTISTKSSHVVSEKLNNE